jgi:hypothetical protein
MGIDMEVIKRQLRHRKLETTMLYIMPNIETGEILQEYINNNKFDLLLNFEI